MHGAFGKCGYGMPLNFELVVDGRGGAYPPTHRYSQLVIESFEHPPVCCYYKDGASVNSEEALPIMTGTSMRFGRHHIYRGTCIFFPTDRDDKEMPGCINVPDYHFFLGDTLCI